MGINCSNCNCNWNEEANSEMKDLIQNKYNKHNRENSITLKKKVQGNFR